jgi:monoamine oxidase
MRVVVVGAGLAGLEVARRLRGDVVVLEASARPGGRIRTRYEDKGRVAYEAGPWRVPETHTRVRRLFDELGVALVPLRTPSPPEEKGPSVAGLTTWDAHALRTGDPSEADRLDLATGYADETHAASAPYTTSAERYYVAPEGFSRLVERLAATVDADVRYDHRVVDVTVDADAPRRRYVLTVRRRVGHNAFRTETVRCDALAVCVPPHVCKEWTVFRAHARSVLSAVVAGPLHHIYVRDAAHPQGRHVKRADALGAQFVSSQYEGGAWFQASYTGGRLATLWHHLRLAAPDAFWTVLRTQVRNLVGWTPAEDAEHASHYWPHAYHAWRAVPRFDLARAVHAAVRPNPHALPRVVLAGEAFSSHQAWMEGALETAELAVAALLRPSVSRPLPERASFSLTVEGWTLDVAAWARVHPGGEAALRNHLGEDVTALLHHVGHSDHAWAVVHSLKTASAS